MTFTYRLNSDIFWNSGLIADLETESIIAPSIFAKWRKPEIVEGKFFSNFN